MTTPLEDAIARMLTHNKWRKGDDTVPMADSGKIGLDIETVCQAARRTADVEKRLAEAEEILGLTAGYLESLGYFLSAEKAREFLGRKSFPGALKPARTFSLLCVR